MVLPSWKELCHHPRKFKHHSYDDAILLVDSVNMWKWSPVYRFHFRWQRFFWMRFARKRAVKPQPATYVKTKVLIDIEFCAIRTDFRDVQQKCSSSLPWKQWLHESWLPIEGHSHGRDREPRGAKSSSRPANSLCQRISLQMEWILFLPSPSSATPTLLPWITKQRRSPMQGSDEKKWS